MATTSFTKEQVAKIAHQANKAYCESLGDFSQVDWEDAPEWQRVSATKGVEFHHDHWKKTGLTADPASSHNSWLKEKSETGWTYGPVKDVEKKTHPCFLPYENLPLEQKLKDSLFSMAIFPFLPYISNA